MKIQCDVCNKDEASVFCTADEAALCDGCDHRVHHANKLASKHQRFSLIHPSSSKLSPLCDICQERRALLFCQQDRAILCRECDIPIHSANEHTQNHHRFLFTGVKLSATSTLYSSSSSKRSVFDDPKSVSTDPKAQPFMTTNKKKQKSVPASSAVSNPTPPCSVAPKISASNEKTSADYDGVGSMSSISEYLTETLPGWHVEDLLDFSTNHSFGFCKGDNNNEDLPFFDDDIESNLSSFSSQNLGIWVPQAPSPSMQHSQLLFKENHNTAKEAATAAAANMNMMTKASHNSSSYNRPMWNVVDDCFTVPQISPPSVGSKRFRHF